MSKYQVRACPNCKHFDKKRGCCSEHDNVCQNWLERYSFVAHRNWNSSMDLDCYEDCQRIKEINNLNSGLNGFLTQFNKL